MTKNTISLFFLGTVFVLLVSSCGNKGNRNYDSVELKNTKDTLSWVAGQSMAEELVSSGVSIDKKIALQAFESALNGHIRIEDTAKAYRQALDYIEGEMMIQQRAASQNAMADQQKAEKRYFEKLLRENKQVKQAPSGFYYEVLKSNKGRQAKPGLVVVFHYKGYLADGRLFDQTYGNREPIVHVVGAPMFQALQDAICMMCAGETWRFYFPSEMAFGAEGSTDIPPYSTAIYEIELIDVKD